MNSSTRSVFRAALILYVVLSIAAIVEVLLIGKGPLPDAALAYLRWWAAQPVSPLQTALTWLALGAALLSLVAALAMTAFAAWARPLFAICILVVIATEAVYAHPALITPVENLLDSLLGVLGGGIVVFSYWSSASDGFSSKAT